jgi:small subunit ribosomal protein S9
MAAVLDRFYATGRRRPPSRVCGSGPARAAWSVNRRAFEDYFPRETLRMIIAQPLEVTSTVGQFDVFATVGGGGPTGQAGAVRHGLTRCAGALRREVPAAAQEGGLLTRDPRMRERKKSGQPGARQKFQYSKR